MKNGTILAIIALGVVAFWAWSSGKLGGFTPSAAAATTTGSKSPSTTPAPTDYALITEIPPATTKQYQLGYTTYAKFEQPVNLGNTGFKQWGVTADGTPVVSIKAPQSYPDWVWY